MTNQDKKPMGRPKKIAGRAVNVYLDADAIQRAKLFGNGNVSAGIRKALMKLLREPSNG